MNLKSFFAASLAVFGLAACSSNDDNVQLPAESGSLRIAFSIPSPASSRGIIEEPVTDVKPIIKTANVYVMRGTAIVAQKPITLTVGNFGEATFEGILVGGNEKVVIAANGNEKVADLAIESFQPSASDAGLKNVYYRSESSLTSAVKTTVGGKAHYELANVIVNPIAARVELSGKINFDKRLVSQLSVDVVTPNAFTFKYGNPNLYFPKFLTGNAADKGMMFVDETSKPGFYNTIADRSKVIANHMFAGDDQRIAFRVTGSTYVRVKNADGTFVYLADAAKTYKTPVYKGTNGQMYALPISQAAAFANLKTRTLGQVGSGLVEVTKSAGGYTLGNAITSDVTLETAVTLGGTAKNGFYAFVNFSTASGEILTNIDGGKYAAGSIYKLNFAEVDWNHDGRITEEDVFTPDEDGGGGTEEPSEKADLVVKATVKDWVLKNIVPGVE